MHHSRIGNISIQDRLPPAFVLVVASRVVAMAGVQLSAFAIGVWIYQRTGVASDYAFLLAIGVLPAMLAMPWAGSLTDRLGYHRILPAVALVDALTAGGAFGLARAELFTPAWANTATFVLGLSGAFLAPAQLSMARHVVPERLLGRSNGALQFAWALTTLLGPAIAGVLMARIGFVNVLAIDAVMATLAGLVVLAAMARLPAPPPVEAHADDGGWRVGWDVMVAVPMLSAAVAAQLTGLTAFNALRVLLAPFVLARSDEATLGLVLACAGGGMLVGALGVSLLGGDERRPARAIVLANALIGIVCIVCGIVAGIPALMVGAFLVSMATIVGIIHIDLLFQQALPLAVQGRSAAIRAFLGNAGYVLAALGLGPLVDLVLEPAYGALGIPYLWSALGVAVLAGLAVTLRYMPRWA